MFTDGKLFPIEKAHNHQALMMIIIIINKPTIKHWCAKAPGKSVFVEHRKPVRPLYFSSMRYLKLTKAFTVVASYKPWWFLGPVNTMADSNGHFNKIPLQPTERKRRISGARPIFTTSSHLQIGRSTRPISILWITAFGQYWRPGPALCPTIKN